MSRFPCQTCSRMFYLHALANHQPACVAAAAPAHSSFGCLPGLIPLAGVKRPRETTAAREDSATIKGDEMSDFIETHEELADAGDGIDLNHLLESQDRDSLLGSSADESIDELNSSGPAVLDDFIRDPRVLSNAIMAGAAASAGLSRRQHQIMLDAVHEPGFDPARVLGCATAVSLRLDQAQATFSVGHAPFSRLEIPIHDLVLPIGTPSCPIAVIFDIRMAIAAVLRDSAITTANRLTLNVSATQEPSQLLGGERVAAGSACYSPVGLEMDAQSRVRLEHSPEPLLPIIVSVQLDESRVSAFGNFLLFPVVLIILSLKRPYRHRKQAMPMIAYLPIVHAKDEDSAAARAGAASLLQRALTLSVVRPLERVWRRGFVVSGIAGFACPVRVVPNVIAVVSDHVGLTAVGNINRNGCVECLAKREDETYLDPRSSLHPRRTIRGALLARAAAAAATSKTAAKAALSEMSLHAGENCAFDAWRHTMWNGDPYGFASHSSLCLLHHTRMGYDKYLWEGYINAFRSSKNFISLKEWRKSNEVITRFIRSQPCHDFGIERRRLVSLHNWGKISWWSGEARESSAVSIVAALLAGKWPFADATLQRRLVAVGIDTLHLGSLTSALQWPKSHAGKLNVCIAEVHESFRDVKTEFGFSIDKKNKAHNTAVHLVPGALRIGVPAEYDLGPGVEAVHPTGKEDFRHSSGKGELQENLAKLRSRREFADTEFMSALARRRTKGAALGAGEQTHSDSNDEDDGEDNTRGTCAYATGALLDMRLASLSPALPQLHALLERAFQHYRRIHHSAASAGTPLHPSSPFEAERFYTRLQLKLRRDGTVNRLLRIMPCTLDTPDPYALLHPCMQLFRRRDSHSRESEVDDHKDEEVEADPNGFCEILLVLSYDVRPGAQTRMSERTLRSSKAVEMVLVRRLVPEATASRNSAFVRCGIPGPLLENVQSLDFKHFSLLPLAALAQPRAAFPAFKHTTSFTSLPHGDLTPWKGTHVNVFLQL